MKVEIDGIQNPVLLENNANASLFHISNTLKIQEKATKKILFEHSSYDFTLKASDYNTVNMNGALINSHYTAQGLSVQIPDLESQRTVFISENRVESQNIDLVIKIYCDQEISIFDEFTGSGQFDFVVVQLSEDYLITPEFDIRKISIIY